MPDSAISEMDELLKKISVSDSFESARYSRQVVNLVDKIQVGGGVGVHGSVAVSNGQNVFDRSPSDPELAALLGKLYSESARAIPLLPEKERSAISGDLTTFVTEVARETPRDNWLKLSSDAVLQSASAHTEITGPLVKLVSEILTRVK